MLIHTDFIQETIREFGTLLCTLITYTMSNKDLRLVITFSQYLSFEQSTDKSNIKISPINQIHKLMIDGFD